MISISRKIHGSSRDVAKSIDEQRGGMQGQEVISLDILDYFTSQYLVVISIQNFHRKVSTCTNSVYMYQAL